MTLPGRLLPIHFHPLRAAMSNTIPGKLDIFVTNLIAVASSLLTMTAVCERNADQGTSVQIEQHNIAYSLSLLTDQVADDRKESAVLVMGLYFVVPRRRERCRENRNGFAFSGFTLRR